MKLSSSESLIAAARQLFPEIGLEETKFPKVRREYAQNNENTSNNFTI